MSLTRAARVLLPLALLVLGLGACDDSPAPIGSANELSVLPGVASAAVTEEEVDQDRTGTIVVVDVDTDITRDQLGAVFTRVAALDPDIWAVSVGCGRADWDRFKKLEDCDAATGTEGTDSRGPEERARVLLAGAHAFPDAHVRLDEDALLVDLGDPDPAVITPALAVLRADPVLRDAADLTVFADEVSEPRFAVGTDGPLTENTQVLWQDLLATRARLPADVPAGLVLSATTGGTARISTELQVPGADAPDQLTPQRYGAMLWPYLRAQLDVVAGLADGTQYVASNASSHDTFVVVTRGRPGDVDELGRTWNVEAARYLDSMS